MNFYKRHLGDIAKSCSDLSQGQMGAFDLLLDWHYGNEKPIPLAKDKQYRIGRAVSKAERQNVDSVIAELFTETPAGYVHKRALEEMEKANEQADRNREVGKLGGRPKKTHVVSENNHSGFENETEKNPSHKPLATSQEAKPELPGTPAVPADGPADLIGQFDGHEHPVTPPNPNAPFAVLLNREGFRCTSLTPALVAYAAEGGTVEHLGQVIALAEPGKPAAYVLGIARRELAEQARPITTGPARSVSASRTNTGLTQILEGTRHDPRTRSDMVLDADSGGAGYALPPEPRKLSSV